MHITRTTTVIENILQIHTPFTNVLYDKSRYDK